MTGRRERKKQEKERRLCDAARKLFREQGFVGTSMRQIAEEADMGLGTVYSYVANKVELLDLISRDDLADVLDDAFSTLPREATTMEQIAYIFGKIYGHHGRDRELARVIVKELGLGGDQAAMERAARFQAFFVQLAEVLERGQTRGEVGKEVDLLHASTVIFGLHYFYLMLFLSGFVDEEGTLAQFCADVSLLFQGIGAK